MSTKSSIINIPNDIILHMESYLNISDKFSFHLTNKHFSSQTKVFEESDFPYIVHIKQKIPVIQYPSFAKTERVKHLIILSNDEYSIEKMKERYKYPFFLDCSIKIVLQQDAYIYTYLVDDDYNKEKRVIEYLQKYKRKLKCKDKT